MAVIYQTSKSVINMKKLLSACTVISAVIALLAPPAFGKRAAASPSPAASAAASPAATSAKGGRAFPFHGMVASVDARAKTFTINGKKGSRIFKISDQSAITKTGAPATMKDIVENEEIRGSYWKEADGSLVAKSVKLGPLTEQEKAAEDARKTRRAERKAAKASAAASASPAASATPKP
jgi:hypothetical protein